MKSTTWPARVSLIEGSDSLLSSAGGALLAEAGRATGLHRALSDGLSPGRRTRSRHDPAKIIADLAVSLALGGDCLADVGVLRAQPALFGPVASDPTVSRLIDTLAADPDGALAAIRTARAQARAATWRHRSPVAAGGLVPVDIDGSLVLAHSEKE